MARLIPLLLLGVVLGFLAPAGANPPEEAGIKNALALQGAMEQARYHLYQSSNAKKAVEVLEEQLPRVNGNSTFLRLLRDAYRVYIKDLYLANQAALAQRYYERLCILDPSSKNDPTLRADAAPHKIQPPAPQEKAASILPNFARNLPFWKKDQPPVPAAMKPATVRAKVEDVPPADDPFDAKHRRAMPTPAASAKASPAAQLLAQAEEEFKQRQYVKARASFEQAYHADPQSIAECRDRWAYCVLSHAVEQINQSGTSAATLDDLQRQVRGAVAMAPSLAGTGNWLLQQIEQRQKAAPARPAAATFNVEHLGQNKEGWHVTETPNFRIFHKQDDDFGERVAKIAEQTRVEMARKWFGTDGEPWRPKCELIVHPTGQEYSQMTGVSGASPGHSRIETDPTNPARVIGRRMDMRLDGPGMMDAVLPHETTHIVLAGQFGPFPVPRWADEGIAVLTEPEEKLQNHRRNLLRFHQEGRLFGLRELLQLENYPEPSRVGAFYAQSTALCDFLTRQKGPTVLTQFVRDGLREGYDAALRRHYGWDFPQLEAHWQQQVLGDLNRVAGK